MIRHIARFGIVTCLTLIAGALACNSGVEESRHSAGSQHSNYASTYVEDGAATASVEERTDLSDVVVKARLTNAASGLLRFQSVEYIKGSGPNQFSVKAETTGRDSQWDNQDAVLFLVVYAESGADFEFTDTAAGLYWGGEDAFGPAPYKGDLPEGYTVDSRNPVWLPVTPTSSSSARSSGGSVVGSGQVLTEYDSLGEPLVVSEASFEATVSWMNGPSGSGARSAGGATPSDVSAIDYRNCIKDAIMTIQVLRDYKAYHGAVEHGEWESEMESGAGRGAAVIHRELAYPTTHGTTIDADYDSYVIFGQDAHVFESRVWDSEDANPRNGYSHDVINRRPLPAGTYTFKYDYIPHIWGHCDYQQDEYYLGVTVTVTAPERTVHEAFFDPATTTATLDPATFSIGDTSTTIERIAYASGTVELQVSPAGALAGHDLDFIAEDGTLALTLDPDTMATSSTLAFTLAFAVESAPWAAGDEMMLRVTKDLPPPILDTTFTAGRADTGQNWATGYSDGFVGSIAGSGFTVDGTATAVEAVLWFDHHPVGEVRLGLTAAVDLSSYTLAFSDSAGTEILVLDGSADEVDSSGKILVWAMQELPWADGDTVTLRIRVKE